MDKPARRRAFGTNLINLPKNELPPVIKPRPVLQPKQYVQETYVTEIKSYLKSIETRCRPNYMDHQPELTHKMRRILVEWLFEVQDEFGLEPATIHRAVNYTDRFLSKQEVPREKLQLVGTTSLLLSTKIEEVNPPTAKDFVTLTDNTYSLSELLRCETLILKTLKFDLLRPTTLDFTLLYTTDPLSTTLANLTLLHGHYLPFKYSDIATNITLLCSMLSRNQPVTTNNPILKSLHADYMTTQ